MKTTKTTVAAMNEDDSDVAVSDHASPDLSRAFEEIARDIDDETDDHAERRSILQEMQAAGYRPLDWTTPRGAHTALGGMNAWLLLRHTTDQCDRLVILGQCEDPFDSGGDIMPAVRAYCDRHGMTVDVHQRYPWFWPGYVTCVEIAIDVAAYRALPESALRTPKKRKRRAR